jgi:hypothetical protein
MRHPKPVVAQALRVYYKTEIYGPTLTKILCGQHRSQFYNQHPGACGDGEWFDDSECEVCKRINAMTTAGAGA